MGKFFNHYKSDRAVGFAHPYNERNPEPWQYTLGYRGYDLDVERHVSLWLVGIHPRRPELPILPALPGSKPQSRGSGSRSKAPS
jgi:hypothetical protein